MSHVSCLLLRYFGVEDPMLCFERVADAPKHENTRLALGPNENTKTHENTAWGYVLALCAYMYCTCAHDAFYPQLA